MSSRGLQLIYQWRYLLGQSVFFDPISHQMGLIIRRATVQDYSGKSNSKEPCRTRSESNEDPLYGANPYRFLATTSSGVFRKALIWMVSSAVTLAWFARLESARRERQQTLRRQNTRLQPSNPAGTASIQSDDYSNSTADLTSLPPPPPPPKAKSSFASSSPLTTCPLCHLPRVNPTASTSGYVFCLKCLLTYVQERGTCPMTGKECPANRILRLYEPHQLS